MKTFQNSKKKKPVFKRYMQEKLAITVLVIMLALLLLIGVLYHVIDTQGDAYTQIVLSQQQYDSRVIPYQRGDIVDRNGTYLATTEKVYNLIIDPKQIMSNETNYLEASILALVQGFQYDEAEMRTLILENESKAYIRYARQLSYGEKEAFEDLVSQMNASYQEQEQSFRVKGVWFEEEYRRIYPYDSLASSIVGFATSDGSSGNGGIEQSYNEYLIGTNGREYGYLNDDSNLERVIKSASNGNTIVSTIDVNVQKIVEKHISNWLDEVGADHIGVVVMDPNSGEVLAMSSDLPFDLNNPRDVSERYTADEIRAYGLTEAKDSYNRNKENSNTITEDEVLQYFTEDEVNSFGLQVVWNKEWRNYCISDTFEPGSPSKIFTIAEAMEEGVITGNETMSCDGGEEVGGWYIQCVSRRGHGDLTITEALMESCNDIMMQLSSKIGTNLFGKYQSHFGFGRKTGIDLPGEASTEGLIYDETNMQASDLATNSFGQNYNCTMIQMAAAYSSVINGGSYYEPRVVREIRNEQGAVTDSLDVSLVREVVSQHTSEFIKEALYQTVENGTGSLAQIPGYKVGGKTGTAEKYPRGNGNYVVSFIGCVPADSPEVLVYVVIDTPHVEDQAHSSYASALFQKITAEILPYLNVFPTIDLGNIESAELEKLPEEEGIAQLESSEVILEEEESIEEEESLEEELESEENIELPGQPAGLDV